MKSILAFPVFLGLVLLMALGALLHGLYQEKHTTPVVVRSLQKVLLDNDQMTKEARASITFIMGEDGNTSNRYYRAAEGYYRFHPIDRTEQVITHCRSLSELKDYLEQYPPQNGQAWGRVNIVVHSNEWSDLSVPIFPEGKRTTVSTLQAAMKSGMFTPIKSSVVDQETEILIQGCALGKNKALLKQLATAFDGQPIIRSSIYFLHYDFDPKDPLNCQRYLTDVWYGFYPTGYYPGDIKLSRQFSSNYPQDTIHWQDALERKALLSLDGTYHYKFNIPVNWMVTYSSEEERPLLNSKVEKRNWLQAQSELVTALKEYGIPLDLFRWQFQNTTHTFEDGTIESAILAKGKTTIVCILKPLVDSDKNPLRPSFEEEAYYTTVNAAVTNKFICQAGS